MSSESKVGGLLPCPFCGGHADVLSPTAKRGDHPNLGGRFFPIVRCRRCYVDCPGDNYDKAGTSAAHAWNTRVSAHGQPVVDAVSRALEKLAAEFDELADAAYQECEYGRRDVWRDAAHDCRNRSKRAEWITAALTGADHE